jgi:hypothetical protein
MDNEFYTDNFEQLLKEQADRFTMQPTKRVWHSIYNDLHPARRWPSIAISCLLVISILLLGYFNTNNSGNQNTSSSNLANDAGNTLGKQGGAGQQVGTDGGLVSGNDNTVASVATEGSNVSPSTVTSPINSSLTGQNPLAPTVNNANLPRRTSRLSSVRAIQHKNNQQNSRTTTGQSTQDKRSASHLYVVPPTAGNDAEQVDNNKPVSSDNNIMTNPGQSQTKIVAGNTETLAPVAGTKAEDNANNADGDNQNNEKTVADIEQKTDLQKATAITYIDRAWIDDHAFYNKPRRGKLKNRLSWQAYITPSVTYRTLFENSIAEGRTTLQSLVTNPFVRQPGIENSVDHKPGPSIELGGAVAYQLAKKWQLKVGAQVNYTSYHATANNIQHPITTNIAVNDFTNGSLDIENRSASISNTPGSNNNRLNNYTVQLALPIGFAYKLAGNNDLKFFAGATLQPSFILVGSSPLLSSDRLFYIENNTKQGDASFMRRFNVAMGIETYASFRMGEYTFLAGPQLRYQLLTTNSNKYTIGEKLYNIGIKLGISKKF